MQLTLPNIFRVRRPLHPAVPPPPVLPIPGLTDAQAVLLRQLSYPNARAVRCWGQRVRVTWTGPLEAKASAVGWWPTLKVLDRMGLARRVDPIDGKGKAWAATCRGHATVLLALRNLGGLGVAS